MTTTKNLTTSRLIISGHCNGASLSGVFAILLRQYGNVSIAEVK